MTQSTDFKEFRTQTGNWIDAHFPASLRGRSPIEFMARAVPADEFPEYHAWRTAIADQGWGTPTWPREYGGGGLTDRHARIINEEIARARAFNPIAGMGVMMFGPTLLEYGNAEQKARHIPPITRGESRWCQGFSEPGAGSDLASLQTRCEDRGDRFLVNGQKIWTSGAHLADWCFCLVRTDTTRKHEGISFILIDMRTPGIEVRPITLISGYSPFCEVFFTDVQVPKENLVGQLNAGWTIAKRLLQFERSSLSGGGPRNVSVDLLKLAREYVGVDSNNRIADPDLRARLIQHATRTRAFQLTLKRVAEQAGAGNGVSTITSILKNAGTDIQQTRDELTIEIMGQRGIGWAGGYDANELEATRTWLGGKATTIYGGTHEIQNNIISKRILGLPDPPPHGRQQ